MTIRDIASIVDIECDSLRGRGVTGAIKIDEDAAQLQNFAQSRRILHGGLRAQVVPRIEQAPASELKGGVLVQMIEIVRIFITAGDGQNARAQDTAERSRGPPALRFQGSSAAAEEPNADSGSGRKGLRGSLAGSSLGNSGPVSGAAPSLGCKPKKMPSGRRRLF